MAAVLARLIPVAAKLFTAMRTAVVVHGFFFFIAGIIVVCPPFPAAIIRTKTASSAFAVFRDWLTAAGADKFCF